MQNEYSELCYVSGEGVPLVPPSKRYGRNSCRLLSLSGTPYNIFHIYFVSFVHKRRNVVTLLHEVAESASKLCETVDMLPDKLIGQLPAAQP